MPSIRPNVSANKKHVREQDSVMVGAMPVERSAQPILPGQA
jgi:hypothetical protein